MQISPETYIKVFIFAHENCLINNLRRAHKIQQSKRHSRRGNRGTTSIVNGISIHKRPSEIYERSISGYWDGDLISGSGNTHTATLVDRKTRFTLLLKLDSKYTISLTWALIKQLKNIPLVLRKSLTWDRGMELAKHQEFAEATGIAVYFCDP